MNGCSYVNDYAKGGGHDDLSRRLGIPTATSLAQAGCNNSRIIRTTLKYSYTLHEPTFYVIGITFINRREVAILEYDDADFSFEGKWTNPITQNQLDIKNKWKKLWSDRDTKRLLDLTEKEDYANTKARVEDLMYSLLSMIDSLQHRGHKVLIFNQADTQMLPVLAHPTLSMLKSTACIIDGLNWRAVKYQDDLGVPSNPEDEKYGISPWFRHRQPGHHTVLNDYLENYIKTNSII
jgi:hypothetical protein